MTTSTGAVNIVNIRY